MRERLRNYGLWVAVGSLAFMGLTDAGIVIAQEKWTGYIDLILYILVLLGVISNPTTKNKWFKDDKNGDS